MKILRHRAAHDDGTAMEFQASPNQGTRMVPEYLVIHYTAGGGMRESADWLCRRESKASAHVVIGRDGRIVQLVPFDREAWHAGASSWGGRNGLNHFSIGIELDNAGRLQRQGHRWRAWFGGLYDNDDVIEAVHRNESAACGWHVYPEAQLAATLGLAARLVDQYGLRDVLGHDDISPGRKSDPGPAFPMASFRARLFGRRDESTPLFRTLTGLNIRTGPGTQHPLLPMSPLPLGTRVEVLRQQDSWRLVDVLDVVAGVADVQGWVHQRFLAAAPPDAAEEGTHRETVVVV